MNASRGHFLMLLLYQNVHFFPLHFQMRFDKDGAHFLPTPVGLVCTKDILANVSCSCSSAKYVQSAL